MKKFRQGEELFRMGDDDKTIFFSYSGEIGIFLEIEGKRVRISTIHAGEIFGEMAYLLEEKRSATAVAVSDSVLFIVSPAMFEELIRMSQDLSRDVIQMLSDRLRKSHAYMKP